MKKAIAILISMVLSIGVIGCGTNINSNGINGGQVINDKNNVEKSGPNLEEDNSISRKVDELDEIIPTNDQNEKYLLLTDIKDSIIVNYNNYFNIAFL